MVRGFHPFDPIFFRCAGHGVIQQFPGGSIVPCQLHVAIAGSRPNRTRCKRGFIHRYDRGVAGFRIGCEIWTDHPPLITTVDRLKQVIGAEIERIGIVRRDDKGRVPVKTQTQSFFTRLGFRRLRLYVFLSESPQIQTCDVAALRLVIYDVGI